MSWNEYTWAFLAFFAARRVLEAGLDVLQIRHLRGRRGKTPKHLAGKVDQETLDRAVDYNLEKLRFGLVTRLFDAALPWLMIFFGFGVVESRVRSLGLGDFATSLVFVAVIAAAAALWSLPFEAYFVFGIEQRNGFNRRTPASFALDKLKGLLIGGVVGGVLAVIVLSLLERGGDWWWLIAFAAVAAVQLAVAWVYPLVVMPLFNRFAPVSQELRGDIAALATRARFPLGKVVSMDGSRRSAHSNAFVTGLPGARRIVLYDTLLAKLERPQLLAVLAHELGHFVLGHSRRRLAAMLAGMAALFAGFGWLAASPGAYTGLGFGQASGHAAIALFVLFAWEALFPFSWLGRLLTRRDEHAADRFAARMTGNGDDLSEALVALTKQNLTSPGSHKWYRAYYNTHPSLRDRLRVIREESRASNGA